jgi:hypothetical protein
VRFSVAHVESLLRAGEIAEVGLDTGFEQAADYFGEGELACLCFREDPMDFGCIHDSSSRCIQRAGILSRLKLLLVWQDLSLRQRSHGAMLSSRPKEESMRLVIALLALVFAAGDTASVSQSQPQAAGAGQGPASQGSTPSADSPMEFLITSAAADFHAHRPPVVERFRNVRFGHVMTQAGAKQYQLCGEFLPQQPEGKAAWTPFATIKTSGYEQYLGLQAATWCQRPKFLQDSGDLSSTLQKRLDAMQ